MRSLAVLGAATVLLTVACGGSGEPETSNASSDSVEIEVVNIAFATDPVEIEAGTEVVWTNRDEGVHHTVTSGLPGDKGIPGADNGTEAKPDGVFHGDLPEAGDTFSFEFTEPGTYEYFCQVHFSMTGTVEVS